MLNAAKRLEDENPLQNVMILSLQMKLTDSFELLISSNFTYFWCWRIMRGFFFYWERSSNTFSSFVCYMLFWMRLMPFVIFVQDVTGWNGSGPLAAVTVPTMKVSLVKRNLTCSALSAFEIHWNVPLFRSVHLLLLLHQEWRQTWDACHRPEKASWSKLLFWMFAEQKGCVCV